MGYSALGVDGVEGAEFFRQFVATFVELAYKQDTPVWLYFRKTQRLQAAGRGLKDSDWTPMMITFLDLLAWKLGFVQLYERPVQGVRNWRRDCIWVGVPDLDPTTPRVTLEAENNSEGVFSSEVPKLLSDPSALKVLITYPVQDYAGQKTVDKWQAHYLPRLKKAIADHSEPGKIRPGTEFLLVQGDNVWWNPLDWYGFCLSYTESGWTEDWSALPRP